MKEYLSRLKILLKEENARIFIGYILFAGIATLVDVGLLYLLTEKVGLWYLYSAVFAYIAGMITNFSLNKYYNFKNKSKAVMKQFSVFIGVALIGLGLNQLILYGLVEYLGIHFILAKVCALAVIMFWSFYGHKHLTFTVFQ